MTSEQLEAFMSDRELLDLIEEVKVSDDILDVIDLSEPQHSAMLAWCLTPTEGHGQGDAVIKDFLLAAYEAAQEDDCKFHTRKFFEHWTPSRLRRTSFGSAFLSCEFHVDLPEQQLRRGISKRKGRLDLLLVDPENRIVVAIENKAGARLDEEQLTFYSERVRERIGARPAFNEFQFAFVVLDRNLGDYDEDDLASLGNRWCLLDYTWLEAAAARAAQHVARNNHAAQLLMAYCQHLTGWEKPSQIRTSDLAARLAERHRGVIDRLRDLKRSSIQEWTPRTLREDALCIFYHQNRPLCTELVRASGIPGLVRSLQRTLGPKVMVEKNGPTRASLSSEAMRRFQRQGQGWWPMYLHLRRRDQEDPGASFQYDVRFIVRNDAFDSLKRATEVRRHLNSIVKGTSTFPESNHRRIRIGAGLGASECTQFCADWLAEIDGALAELE